MSGNGAVIGMAFITVVLKAIQQDLLQALTACFVAVVGTSTRGTSAYRAATTTRLALASTLLASALPAVQIKSVVQAKQAGRQTKHC